MPKPKTCQICDQPFEKTRHMQKVCSPLCAIEYPKFLEEKKRAQAAKRQKADFKLEDRSHQIKLAQSNFNRFIRLRDHSEPCISCQRHHKGQYHAGHYRTVGAHPELRFEEMNCWKQCSACNNHLSGNIADYRINLVKKIGVEKVEWLEGFHESKKYTTTEIIEIKKHYAAEARRLEKAIESLCGQRWLDTGKQ